MGLSGSGLMPRVPCVLRRPGTHCIVPVCVCAAVVCMRFWVLTGTACVCAFGVRSGRCWRGCAVLWMVSTAGKPSQVVLGQAPCSLGVWGDVGRPHRVATVSQPCSCPYGVREKVLSYAWSVVRVKLSGWYKYFRVVLIHPLGDSVRVGALRFARYGQVKKVRCAHSSSDTYALQNLHSRFTPVGYITGA